LKRASHLFEKVLDFHNLCASARQAAKGKKPTLSSDMFLMNLESQVLALQRELYGRTYAPGPYRSFLVRDPKVRVISAAPFRDRVVHHSLCRAIEPVLERYAISDSYACRIGKGNRAAVERVQNLASGYDWYLKLDVMHFFETADHAILMGLLGRLIKDPGALWLLRRFVEGGPSIQNPGKGLPIGNLTSQHFANLYLGPLDHFVKEKLRLHGYVRYMDDMIMLGRSMEQMVDAWAAVDAFLRESLSLSLRTEVCMVNRVDDGVPFLGFRIWRNQIRFDGHRKRRFQRRVGSLASSMRRGTIGEEEFAARMGSLTAWARQANTLGLRRTTFGLRGIDHLK